MDELKSIKTSDLVEELTRRHGVAQVQVSEHSPFSIAVDGANKSLEKTFGHEVDSGPARILVVVE